MKFKEFLEVHAVLMPAVNFAEGTVAFYDLMRTWNSIAILMPNKCEDVVVWDIGAHPTMMANDIDVAVLLQETATKELANLPNNLRITRKQVVPDEVVPDVVVETEKRTEILEPSSQMKSNTRKRRTNKNAGSKNTSK